MLRGVELIDVAAVVGALAWLPHLIEAIKRWLDKPILEVYPEEQVEIGYTIFGPIMNLRMALMASLGEVVIKRIGIILKHESGEKREFEWKGYTQVVGNMKLPTGEKMPFEKELAALAVKILPDSSEERFVRFQEKKFIDEKSHRELPILERAGMLQSEKHDWRDKLMDSDELKTYLNFLTHQFWWKSGKYEMELLVETTGSAAIKNRFFNFSLMPVDIQLLEENRKLIPLSVKDEVFAGEKDYAPNNVRWMWRYPRVREGRDAGSRK